MKKNEFNAIKNKPVAEIEKELAELRTKRVNLKFDLVAGKVKNIREIQNVKMSIVSFYCVAGKVKTEVKMSK